ncbi:MAG: TIGR02221 family CRISPR-associated protein [Thermoplasmataceae archaeon]
MNEHIILTALGTRSNEETYSLNGKNEKATVSTLALIGLLQEQERPDKVIVLCTNEIDDKKWEQFKNGLKEYDKIECDRIDIRASSDVSDLVEVIQKVLLSVPKDANISLDLTHGLRSISLLFYTSAIYLTALKNVKIKGVWYGMMEKKLSDGTCPMIDLSILFNLIDWFQAVKIFKEYGNPREISKLIEQGNKTGSVVKIGDIIKEFGSNYATGLPLELSGTSSKMVSYLRNKEQPIKSNNPSEMENLLIPEIFKEIESVADSYKTQDIKKFHGEWKKNLSPENSIKTQVKLIDNYLKNHIINNAIGLIRELLVTVTMVSISDPKEKIKWLSRKERLRVEKKLGSLLQYSHKSMERLGENQKKLAEFWNTITDNRNKIHHNGMDYERIDIKTIENKVNHTWNEIKEKINYNKFWNPEFGGGKGSLLISSLGYSPGSLYTAINCTNPDYFLIISSKQAIVNIDIVLEKTSFPQGHYQSVILEDPFNDPEVHGIAEKYTEFLAGYDKVICNITGGTAFMQWCVQKFGEKAKELGKEVEWVAMIDRRTLDEQRKEPYVLGEKIVLNDGVDQPGSDVQ